MLSKDINPEEREVFAHIELEQWCLVQLFPYKIHLVSDQNK